VRIWCRIQEQYDLHDDPDVKLKLRRFRKGLLAAHDDVAAAKHTLKLFEDAEEGEHEALVVGHRDALSPAFFEYLKDVVASLGDGEEEKKQKEEVVRLGSRIAALLSAFERAQADEGALGSAAERFNKLLEVGAQRCSPRSFERSCTSALHSVSRLQREPVHTGRANGGCVRLDQWHVDMLAFSACYSSAMRIITGAGRVCRPRACKRRISRSTTWRRRARSIPPSCSPWRRRTLASRTRSTRRMR
jgi:prefoldin subunit 5